MMSFFFLVKYDTIAFDHFYKNIVFFFYLFELIMSLPSYNTFLQTQPFVSVKEPVDMLLFLLVLIIATSFFLVLAKYLLIGSRLYRTAGLLTRTNRQDHSAPVSASLHWLQATFRINFKILQLTFKFLFFSFSPSYS